MTWPNGCDWWTNQRLDRYSRAHCPICLKRRHYHVVEEAKRAGVSVELFEKFMNLPVILDFSQEEVSLGRDVSPERDQDDLLRRCDA